MDVFNGLKENEDMGPLLISLQVIGVTETRLGISLVICIKCS